MDTAVGLVETYLRVNGYFTVTEFPVIESFHGGSYRTVTDLDVLAFRFPGAGRLVPRRGGRKIEARILPPDSKLCSTGDGADMIIHADFKDPAFDFLVMLEKARQGFVPAGAGGDSYEAI